ncbi:amidohydrolase family protein [Pararoseomonas indoligenes]|uniref:Amidohydrolase family protein n=1 Tax=Roseomonas indoligenes TaxID=2820811 RepID=A0A940S6N4_9PROT|nr:amidohydrolase family protein [Pararoseomonas indoligenes]MBP0495716.1 amidohydrolase family protein [Pararoseomonas indoligenes]
MDTTLLPEGTTLLIAGARVLLPDADWHAPGTADIAIGGDRILGIAGRFAPRPGEAPPETLDARGHLVMPGFVNAHYHSHDVLAKGTLEEVPLEQWRLYALPAQYPPRSVAEVRARTMLGALECLRSGMTTVQDMLTLYPFDPAHLDTVIRTYEELGIRVVFSLQYGDRKGLDTVPFWKEIFPPELHPLLSSAAEPEKNFDLLSYFEENCLKAPARSTVHWALGPSAPERCTPGLMARTTDLAKRYDLPVYSHIYESKGMALQARHELGQYGGSLIRRLHAEGALGPHMNFAHSVWLAPDEIEILAETGAGTVLNPQGNLKMKCGIPPIRGLMNAGVRIGLGCDNCSCSDAQNMFVAMKLFSLLSTVSDVIKGPPPAMPALRAATEGGADGARLGHLIGRIAPGYKADLTVIDLADPSFVPMNSMVRQLVNVEAGRAVRHVMVDGKWVLKDRRVTTVDERAIFEEVAAVMPTFRQDFAEITARVARLQPWLDQAQARMDASDVGIQRLPQLS